MTQTLERRRAYSVVLSVLATALAALLCPSISLAQTGACCVGTVCSLRTLASCDGILGDWLGPGTTCAGSPCASPPATCCVGTTCSIQNSSQCANAGGIYLGGTTCAPNPCSGSCCVNGNCSLTSSPACITAGGSWQRFGSCSPNNCPGPCCENGQCTITILSRCTGSWTPGGTCFPNACPAPQCDFGVTANTGGRTTGVARITGTTGLLVARGTTLEIFNAVNPNAPVPFSPPRRISLQAQAVKIVVSSTGNRVFASLEDGSVLCATILSSPQLLIVDPVYIQNAGSRIAVTDLEVDGDRVFVPRTINQQQGVTSYLSIYQYNGTGNPQRLSQFEPALQNFRIDRIARVGNTLWLGMHGDQLTTYAIEGWDISNSAAPVRRSTIAGFADLDQGETNISGMHAIGNKLLVSFYNVRTGVGLPNAGDNLRAADVTNPASPVWQPEFVLGGQVQCMSANGNQLRVGLGNGIQTWDTTNPAALVLLGTLANSSSSPLQISSGTPDYVALGRSGLQTASFANPSAAQVLATLTPLPAGGGLTRQLGNTSVVWDYEFETLRVFDYSLQEGQQLRGSIAASIPYADLMELTTITTGSRLLICVGDSVNGDIKIFDVTSSTSPTLRAVIAGAGVWRMCATASRLYVITSSAQLKIYDLNPTTPTLLSTTQYGGTRFDYTCMTSWQNGSTQALALGTASFGLWLLDATNAASPQLASVYSPVVGYSVNSLVKGASFLYVSASSSTSGSRLESLQVTNLASPTALYVSGANLGGGEATSFSSLNYVSVPTGKFLFGITTGGFGAVLMDIGGPLGESVISRIFGEGLPASALEAAVNPTGSLVLSTGSGGFQQMALPQSWAPGFSAPAPGRRTACLGSSAVVQAQASASPATITYQWFRSGNPSIPLANGPTPWGSIITGATTPTLTISNIRSLEAGTSYFCRATNSCGPSDSRVVELNVCIADFNCTNTLTVQDVFDFLAAWFTAQPLADVNSSGSLTVQDIFDFLTVWFTGC